MSSDEIQKRISDYMARKEKYERPHKIVNNGKVISDGKDDPEYQQWQFEQSLFIYHPDDDPPPTPSDAERDDDGGDA